MSKAPQKKVPELRFPEFKGEWVEKRLGDISERISSGRSSTTGAEGIHPVYGSTGMIGFSELPEYTGESILIARVGANAGSLYRVQGEYGVSDNTLILRPLDGLEFHWIFFYLKKANLNRLVFGSGQPLITGQQLKVLKIGLPSLSEQKKIAAFLSAVDQRIEGLEKKRDFLKEYKKGLMQQLFSQILRFMDDNGKPFPDWEETTVGKVAEITGGGTPDTTVAKYWGGDIQWFTPTEIKSKYLQKSQRTITDAGLRKSSAKLLPKGTLLFSSRATVGDVGIALQPCTTNQGFQSMVVRKGVSNEFLYYWIIENKKQFLRRSSGSTFLEISKTEIQRIKMRVPHFDEQKKIADCLLVLDRKIESVEAQTLQAREFKRGLLQKMFV